MRLGGGARNANVLTALQAGNHAITHGRCKGVGVAALTLGGGIGFSQRLHGLTLRSAGRDRDRHRLRRAARVQRRRERRSVLGLSRRRRRQFRRQCLADVADLSR